jgi:hypothetical protein
MTKGKYKKKRAHRQHKTDNAPGGAIVMEGKKAAEDHKKPAQQGTSQTTSDADPSRWFRFKEWLKRDKTFTDWAIAAFTLVLAGSAIYQFIIMGGQLKVMKLDQRAWIAPKVSDSSEPARVQVGAGKSVVFPTLLQNIGKSVALDLNAKLFVEFVASDKAPNLSRIDTENPNTVVISKIVFPNEHAGAIVRRMHQIGETNKWEDEPATLQEQIDMTTGKNYFSVYGIVNYWDIYKVPHWVKFCRWIGNPDQQYPGARKCAEYTEADDN